MAGLSGSGSPDRDNLRVLLGEGSSSSARQTLYGLSERYTIGILDPDPLCQCRFSRRVRRVHRSPGYAKDPVAYLRYLLRVVEAYQYGVLLPTHEQVYLIARFREELGDRVAIALPDIKALRVMQSKAAFVRAMQALGLPVPPTRFVRRIEEVFDDGPYPCFIKLPHSTAGDGVRLARGPHDARCVAEEYQRQGRLENVSEIVVQQPAEGVQSVVQTVFQHGHLVAAHCVEALRKVGISGGTMVRVGASHPTVIEDMRRLGSHLAWHGPMFLEYFYDPSTGRAQYIEANPRIGETVNALLSGVNIPEIVVRVSLEEKVEPMLTRTLGVRSHTGFLFLLALALEGADRRTLLKQLLTMCRGVKMYENCANETTRIREDWLAVIPAAATIVQLLIAPRAARRILQKAVGNYALPESAVKLIDTLSWNDVVESSAAR